MNREARQRSRLRANPGKILPILRGAAGGKTRAREWL
jgi:hypothetical protein